MNKLVLNWSMANSGQSVGSIGWDLEKHGWPGFIERHVKPAVRWCNDSGVTPVILLHHAFGQYGDPMHVDGWDYANAFDVDFAVNKFDTTTSWPALNATVESYAYVGGAAITPRLNALPPRELASVVRRNLLPYKNAKFKGVFVDFAENAVVHPHTDPYKRPAQDAPRSVDSLVLFTADKMFSPVKAGIEAAPRSFPDFQALWSRNIVAQDEEWRYRYGGLTPEQYKKYGYERGQDSNYVSLGYDRSILTGEVWRTIPFGHKYALELAQLIVKEKDVPAISPLPFIQTGIKASEVFA